MPARLCFALFLLATAGCTERDAAPARVRLSEPAALHAKENWKDSCPATFDPRHDYFPEKTSFVYSTQLRVEYHESFKLISFTPSLHQRDPLRFVLYQCGTPRPAGIEADQFIEVPAQRVVLNEPSLGESMVELGALSHLFAVNDSEAYTAPAINAAIESGKVRALGSRYGSTIELATAADPDLVFLFYSAAPNANLHPALVSLGVQGIPLAPHFERNALGRAEWLKFTALFFNREAEANRLLSPRIERYQSLATLVRAVTHRPGVVLGFASNRDTWTAPGAQNVYAQTVRDAGGRYFLVNESTNSNVKISFEQAMGASENATVWIGLTGVNRVANLRALLKSNAQLADMGPVHRGTVFAMDRGLTPQRTFPFLDQSIDHPDDMLHDFILAIHPEMLPNSPPVFLRQLR